MKYENARRGLGKVFAGEIVSIIATIIGIIAAVIMSVRGTALQTDGALINTSDIVSLLSAIGALGLTAIAFILNLVGVIGASKDDEGFKNALILLIIGIIASIVSTVLATKHPNISGYLSSLSDICQLFVLYYVVCGCLNIAEAKRNTGLAASCKRARIIILIIWVISLVLNFFNNSSKAKEGTIGTVTLILAIAGGVATILSYIIYLSVLRRTIDTIG
jgi:hypothetical protein